MNLTDLKPGDRVMLCCPTARVNSEREAEFCGVFASLAQALRHADSITPLLLDTGATTEYLSKDGQWAAFLFQTTQEPVVRFHNPNGKRFGFTNPHQQPVRLFAAFRIKDGGLIDEEQRPISILRRVEVLNG